MCYLTGGQRSTEQSSAQFRVWRAISPPSLLSSLPVVAGNSSLGIGHRAPLGPGAPLATSRRYPGRHTTAGDIGEDSYMLHVGLNPPRCGGISCLFVTV